MEPDEQNSHESTSRGPTTAKVALAIAYLDQPPLEYSTNAELLNASLVPGTEERRYGKVWRLGQARESPHSFHGRLGFERDRMDRTDVWDEERQDFVESEFPRGVVSPFSIRLSDLVIAFQLRGNDIAVGSFTNALEALMSTASGLRWRVVPLRKKMSFAEWSHRVRVTSLKAVAKRPNPDYKGRPDVEEFIEGPNAEMTEARWTAADGSELNVEDQLIRQFVAHSDEKKYGHVTAKGLRGRETVTYSNGGESRTEVVSPDPDTGDVGLDILDEVLDGGSGAFGCRCGLLHRRVRRRYRSLRICVWRSCDLHHVCLKVLPEVVGGYARRLEGRHAPVQDCGWSCGSVGSLVDRRVWPRRPSSRVAVRNHAGDRLRFNRLVGLGGLSGAACYREPSDG